MSSERIDRVCLEFEDAWQAGKSPQLAEYLNGWCGIERSLLLKELLLLELHYLRRRGVEPEADQYLARFPDDRVVVVEVFGIRESGEPFEFAQGQRIGRYTIERQLGGGSFGTVYQAWDTELERMVALKIPRRERFNEERDIEAFIEEARMAAKLDNPAIVPVLDVVRDAQQLPMIVMAYVEGESLRDRMLAERLSHLTSMELLIDVAETMDYAHRRGFVHRDLEPRNILLDTAGKPHITDFGLAVHESTQKTKEGESAGSLAYMSPEQLRGDSHWLDGRADIWAIGVIMYELLTGRRPFGGRTFDELASEIFIRDPKPLRQIDAEIPAELEQICLTCLAKPIASRYATAHDLANALRQAVRSLQPNQIGSSGASLAAAGSSTAGRRMVIVAVASVLAIAIATSIGFGLAAGGGWWGKSLTTAVRDIELSVYTSSDHFRGRINKSASEGAPLQTGDKVRLSVVLDQPAYLYVLWIGTAGDVTPIYPWPAGRWERPGHERPTKELSLPADAAASWQVQPGAAGTETIIAFVAHRPLPLNLDIPALVAGARPQTGDPSAEPLWFDNGRLLAGQAKTRSPDVQRPLRVEDPVISNQLIIMDQLKAYCSSAHALCFPITGG